MIKYLRAGARVYVVRLYRQRRGDEGSAIGHFFPDAQTGRYDYHQEAAHILIHNHLTAISPWLGAATDSGDEICDEGATGRDAKPKAGLVGFSVSNLRISDFEQPWEEDCTHPALTGYFRT
ncbi:MAG: Phosphoribosylformylglycinamidine synthase [Sodalis sp.]|nr:MAG: Phosphoribosylformylglycinamidine synthase [Sodalis sp.]